MPSIIPVFFDLLAAQAQLGAGLSAASARRGVPARLRLARRRRAEARLSCRTPRCLAARGAPADLLYTLLVVSLLVFGITQILPADAAVTLLGENATPEALAAVRAKLGLGDPAWLQYWHWLSACCTAISAPRCAPASRSARRCSSRSAARSCSPAVAIALMLVLAVPLGILAALRRGKAADVLRRPRLLSRRVAAGVRHRARCC